MPLEFSVAQHFVGKDLIVGAIYNRILIEVRKFGTIVEDPKKTSIHLNSKSAFAGVRTQKTALILNVKSAVPIKSKRFSKMEQVSASRYHQEVKLTSPDDVDDELVNWLKEAYLISG